MKTLGFLFQEILYKPFFNVLILLCSFLPGNDLGIAIILLTFAVRMALYPLGVKAIKSQKAIADLQPKVKELQEKYKDNKEEQAMATLELYKKEKVSPFSGFAPMLVQLPILIALYMVFQSLGNGLDSGEISNLYSFVAPIQPGTHFLGIVNLVNPSRFIAVLAGVLQFIQVKISSPKIPKKKGGKDISDYIQKQTLYFLPMITVFFLFSLPAAIGLYWCTTTIFTIIQQHFVFKKIKPQP